MSTQHVLLYTALSIQILYKDEPRLPIYHVNCNALRLAVGTSIASVSSGCECREHFPDGPSVVFVEDPRLKTS